MRRWFFVLAQEPVPDSFPLGRRARFAPFPGRFLILVGSGLAMVLAVALAERAAGQDRPALRVLGEEYPRAYFFRSSEGFAANPRIPYNRWDRCFSRLMGIEGKVLEEEVPGRSLRNIDFFTRFKREHPEQLVLLHYNGNARDPRFDRDAFFAGHFLYHNGARILDDVPAEEGETEITVSDPSCFRTGIGRYRQSNDDIGLCLLDPQSRPDWRRSEQVQLLAVDPERKVIRVRRACYGTRPMALPAGRAYAAAHVTEGPWGRRSHLLWFYNYSTACPRDPAGRNCAEVHCQDLAQRFLPGGELEAFDGLEFDVLHHQVGGGRARGPDCDADGQADRGLVDGVNTYGIGVVQFCRSLRQELGPQRLILADGMSLHNQRAFGILNGVESEGWPTLSDWEIRDWSGGLNRHRFWAQNSHAPTFNYINHKFTTAGPTPGSRVRPDVPWSIHRLVFAAALFTDSAICYAFPPPAEPGEMLGIWDELRGGTKNRMGWLGRPLGPPVRLATARPDALAGGGNPPARELARRVAGDGVTVQLDRDGLKIQATDPQAPSMRFRLRGVPCDGPDLVVSLTARGSPRKPYPPEIARLMWVGIAPPEGTKRFTQPVRHMTWVNQRPFTSHFYFSEIRSDAIDLALEIEGGQPVWITAIQVHHHPDAIARRFEHGLVLANPSPRPYSFQLSELAPGQRFRRLNGSPRQDPQTNDGSPVQDPVVLGPKDALFLEKR